MRKLPVELRVAYTADCRIQQRLSIIQTLPKGNEWLYTHFNCFMTDSFDSGIGSETTVAGMDYFNDILVSKEVNLWEIKANRIVDVIREAIDRDEYIIIDLYFGSRYSEMAHKTYSLLVYGYDEVDKNLYSVWLKGTLYFERVVGYKEFEEYYSDVYKEYTHDPGTRFSRLFFNYSITSVKPRMDYSCDNTYFLAINRLSTEGQGNIVKKEIYDVLFDHRGTLTYYTGVSIYQGIKKLLHQYSFDNLLDNNNCNKIKKTILTLIESRKVNLSAIKWISAKIDMDKHYVSIILDLYKRLLSKLNLVLSYIMKYQYKNDSNYIEKASVLMDDLYRLDKEALCGFVDNASKRLIEKMSYSEYISRNKQSQ